LAARTQEEGLGCKNSRRRAWLQELKKKGLAARNQEEGLGCKNSRRQIS
jgi:hypothetical protein